MQDELLKKYLIQMDCEEKKNLAENANLIEKFLEKTSNFGLHLSLKNIKYIQTIGIVACYPNIVETLCQDLHFDKEDLTEINDLLKYFKKKPPKEGNLYNSDIVIMAHPYFRRGFYENNNFAPRFIELFWTDKQTEVEKYIAIDKNRIRIDVNGPQWFERDTWFGPKFNTEINKIEDGTVHLRPTPGLKEQYITFFFADAYSLNVKWNTKNGIKTFQAEEFKTERVSIEKNEKIYYPARYLHAEFDLEKKYFRHFDGSVHLYSFEEYEKRKDSDFNYNIKSKHHIKGLSQKLFKFNGKISTENFIEYSSHFFAGNPLMFEYFEGKYPKFISDKLDMIIDKT